MNDKDLNTKLKNLSVSAILGLGVASNLFAAEQPAVLPESKIKDKTKKSKYLIKNSSTVGKMNIPLKDTARSVKVLNNDFIEDTSSNDVGDLFDYVPGMSRNGTSDRSFFSRGQSVNINNLLMDGLRTSQGGEGGTSTRFPSTFNVESVDFLRGPSSTLYGVGSGFGLINVNTKRPKSYSAYEINYGYKTFISKDTGYFKRKAFNFGFDATGPINNNKSLLYRAIVQTAPKNEMYQKGRKRTDNFASLALTYRLSDDSKITPQIVFRDQKRTSGTSYGDGVVALSLPNYIDNRKSKIDLNDIGNRALYYGGKNDYGKEKVVEASVLLNQALNNNWKTNVKFIRKHSKSDTEDLYTTDSSNPGYKKDGKYYIGRKYVRASAKYRFTAIDANIRGDVKIGNVLNKVLLGINYSKQNRKSARVFQQIKKGGLTDHGKNNYIEIGNPDNQQVLPKPNLALNYRTTKTVDQNLYLSDAIYFNNFILTPSFAILKNKKNGKSKTLPSKALSLVYKLNNEISTYVSYSEANEPTRPWRANRTKPDGSTDFKAKVTTNYEIGLKSLFDNDKHSVSLSLFNMKVKNPIESIQIKEKWYYIQLPKGYVSKGLEANANFNFNDFYSTILAYSYINAYYAKDKSRRQGIAKNSFTAWNTFKVTPKLKAALGLIYESPKVIGRRLYYRTDSKTKMQVDLAAYYKLSKITKLSFNIKNLLDEKRLDSGSPWQLKTNAPRSFALRVSHRF